MAKPSINSVLIVYKQSNYDRYLRHRNTRKNRSMFRKKHPEIGRRLKSAHDSHHRTLDTVKKTLKRLGIPFKTKTRLNLGTVHDHDLVLTVGGDGTFLLTSHRLHDQLVMGINSAPEMSVGALCSIHGKDFPRRMEAILKGHYSIRLVHRLSIEVNGKFLPVSALNDVLFANQCPAGTSRYTLQIGKKKEDQISSGLWISTASGSTAAIRAAGGKTLKAGSSDIQYLVREPFQGGKRHLRLTHGLIKAGSSLEIINTTLDAALFVDGVQTIYPLHYGDHIRIRKSPKPLHVIL